MFRHEGVRTGGPTVAFSCVTDSRRGGTGLATMSDHAALDDIALDIKATAANFPPPTRDVADRLVDLLVPFEHSSASRDGAA